MRRRSITTALAAVSAVLLLSTVAAQAAAERPVVGGGSFNDATVLTAGSYQDTIRPNETLFYAVRLTPGQRLSATVGVQANSPSLTHGPTSIMTLSEAVTNPVRVSVGQDGDGYDQGYPPTSLTARAVSPLIGRPDLREISGAGSDYNGPGTWYIDVNLGQFSGPSVRTELPLYLDVEVTGAPAPARAQNAPMPGGATTTGTKPPPRKSRRGAAGSKHGDSGGSSVGTGTLGLAGVLGLLAGALLGALTQTIRRRRAPAPGA